MDVTLTITTQQETALQSALNKRNAQIEIQNRQNQAARELAALNNRPVDGIPADQPLMTLQTLLQERLNERLLNDLREAAQEISKELANTYLNATPAQQQAMLADMAKYRT